MHPSCSQYSKILFESHPLHEAYFGTFERILRCGHELYLYPQIEIGKKVYWSDPPDGYRPANGGGLEAREQRITNEGDETSHRAGGADSSLAQFASFLLERKDYYRAATEYLRLYFLSADSLLGLSFLKQAGLCHFLGGDYNGYVDFTEQNRQTLQSDKSIRVETDLMLGESYYHLEKYQKAISTIEWIGIGPGEERFDEAQFYIGLSYARMYEWETACKSFSQIGHRSELRNLALFLADSVRHGATLSTRQPWIAGTMSAVIPGSGYLYANRPQTAVASFIVNALIIWSLRDAITQESYGLGSVLGFFGLGWYIGNITGSANAAREYNVNIRSNFLDRLLDGVDLEIMGAQ